MTIYYYELGDMEALNWFNKACDTAQEMNDEILSMVAEVLRFRYGIEFFGLQESRDADELKKLLAYFEPPFPNSFVVCGIHRALRAYHSVLEVYKLVIQYKKRCLNIVKVLHDLLWISLAS